MRRFFFIALLILAGPAAARSGTAPLFDPARLNIGFVCQWQENCVKLQEKAMGRALKHVRKYHPPAWKIQLCNRNASRRSGRVDWVGFDHCIRNDALRPPPPRTAKRRR